MLRLDNNKENKKNQMEILVDTNKKGKKIDWETKKKKSILLAESYERLGLRKSYRVKDCATFLEFKRYLKDNKLKLNGANFCKDRLCPMCSWRRSKKIFGQVSKIMERLEKEKKYNYLFLTLTSKNVYGENLAEELDKLFYAINKFFKITKVKKSIKGWFRALEITHNLNINSKNFDTYHPHFHVVVVVEKDYFKAYKKLYIEQNEWKNFWQKSLKVDYEPIVDIRKMKDKKGNKNLESAVAETAKYTVKDNDYLIYDDEEMTDSAVSILNYALHKRRLVAFGGIFKEVHKQLNLDDMEKGNLINTNNDEEENDKDYIFEYFKWNIGLSNYVKFDIVSN